MLYVDLNENFDISASNKKEVKLQFGHNYLFMSPNLLSKDILSLIFIKSLQAEYPVVLISKDTQTLVNLNILHKIYRKSKRMEFKNIIYNLQNRQTYACIPDYDVISSEKYKNMAESLYIQLIDVDNLQSMGFDIYKFANPNAINIFFTKTNCVSVASFSQVFSDFDSNELLFSAEQEIYSKVHRMIHDENLLDDETIHILDAKFKDIFKSWLENGKEHISSFDNLLLNELSDEEQIDCVGDLLSTLQLEIEKRIVKATKEVFSGLVEFEDVYNNSTLFNHLNRDTFENLMNQNI